MGIAEKALLASLKAQRGAVEVQLGALDDETRATMQANLDYLNAQIALLEGGGRIADLAHVPQPAAWGDDDPAVGIAAPTAPDGPLVDVDPAGASAPRLGWKAMLGIGATVLAAAAIAVFWLLAGGPSSGCDIYTSGGGWQHYEAGDPACDSD